MNNENNQPDPTMAARIIEFLNELLEYDRPAVAALIANRAPCNEALANHPSVQVAVQHGGWNVGLLGILNGLCGIRDDGSALIQAIFEDSVTEGNTFRDLARFEFYEPPTATAANN